VAVGLGGGGGLGDGGRVGVGLGEPDGVDAGLLGGVLEGLDGADGRGPGLGRVACLTRWWRATAEPPGEARLDGATLLDAATRSARWWCAGTADAGAERFGVGVGSADLVTMATDGRNV
jgi:hypothetical protein